MAKIYEAGEFWTDWSTWPVDHFRKKLSAATLAPGAMALAFGKLKTVSFFSSAETGKPSRFGLRLLWLFKDVQNSCSSIHKHLNLEIEGENQEKKESL